MTVLAVANPITVEHVVAPGALAARALARAGESVHRFLKRSRWRFDLDTILVINGKPVLRREGGWKLRRFAPGDVVRFVSRPFGGNNGAKQIGGLVALIALTVFAPYVTGPLLASAFGAASVPAWAGALGNALVVAGGMMLYNTLVYPKPGNRDGEDSLFSFNASGNTARPLEPIPLPYGRLQRDLDYAAIPYKSYSGTDEYFNGLFMVGCGSFDHEALLIDDIEFWRADAAATDGTGSGSAGTIPGFTTVWTNSSGNRPSSPGVLEPFEDIQIEFVEPGQPVTLFPTNVHQSPEVNGLEFDHPGSPGGGWSPWFAVCNPGDVTNLIHLDIALPSGFVRNNHETEAAYTVEIRPINDAGAATGPAVSTTRNYQGLHRKPHRFTHSFPQATAARYALRFRRNAAQTSGDTTDFYAAGLRAEIPGETVFPEGTMVAVRIKATKQLSDYSSRRIRYRGTRILPVWTGSAWEDQPTRNPIWAAIDFRTNSDFGGRMPLNRLQLDDFIAEAAAADARGDTFDYEFKNAVKVGEGLDTILAAARAKHRWYGDRLSLVRDQWTTVPRMVVSDREMVAGSFSVTANFRNANSPDGLIVNYIDEETWRPAQVTVPLGSSPVNPVTEELRGVTKRAHATREAIFKWNAQVKRRVAPSFTMMLDGHILGYGDHVEVQSRNPQAWGSSHAVVGLSGSTVRLPRPATWPDGVAMYAAVRTKLGKLFGPCRVTQGLTARHVVFDSDDLAAVVAATGMTLADALDRAADAAPPTLVMGEAFDFLKRMQVVSAEPRGDKAQISGFLDYEEVHEPDEVEEAPRPPIITFPARDLPRVTSLDARLVQVLFETRLEASWPASPTATRYVVEVRYEDAALWVPVYDGPVPACDVVVDNYTMEVRCIPYGDRGAGYASPTVALLGIGVTLPAGSVDRAALDAALQRTEEVVNERLHEAREFIEGLAAWVQGLEQQTLENLKVTRQRLEAINGAASARLEEVRVVLAEEDEALTSRLNTAESTIGGHTAAISDLETTRVTEAQAETIAQNLQTSRFGSAGAPGSIESSIEDLETTKVDAAGATSIAQAALAAVFGAGTANVKMRLAAVATPAGYDAMFQIEASVTGADGTYKATGLLMAVLTVGGVQVSRIQFKADQTQFLDNAGDPFAVFDATTRTLLVERIKSGDINTVTKITRAVPGSDHNVGSGTTTTNNGNSFISSGTLGSVVIPANPGAIGDGAAGSDYCPVLCFTKVRVAQPTIGYPIIVNSIEYRVRLIPVSGTSFTVASGLVLPVSVYTGSVMAYGYYPARESYVSDYTQVKAGTYNVSIEWRWSNDTGNALADNAIGIRLGADIIIDTRRR